MVANLKSHAVSQTAYARANGNFDAFWETACGMKGLNQEGIQEGAQICVPHVTIQDGRFLYSITHGMGFILSISSLINKIFLVVSDLISLD